MNELSSTTDFIYEADMITNESNNSMTKHYGSHNDEYHKSHNDYYDYRKYDSLVDYTYSNYFGW